MAQLVDFTRAEHGCPAGEPGEADIGRCDAGKDGLRHRQNAHLSAESGGNFLESIAILTTIVEF